MNKEEMNKSMVIFLKLMTFISLPLFMCFCGKRELTDFDYRNKAYKAQNEKNHQEALLNFSKAIELNPKSEYFSGRALVKELSGDTLGAINDYSQAIKASTKDDLVYFDYQNRANLLYYTGKYLNALEDYSKAVELDESYTYYNMRAIVYLKISRWEEAIKDCNNALIMQKEKGTIERGDAYFHKAIAYYHLGNNNEACFNYYKWADTDEDDWHLFEEEKYKKIFEGLCYEPD